MKPIKELLGDYQDAEAEARRKYLEVQEELEEGQKAIATGEDSGTGNLLHDGLIVLYGKDLVHPDQQIEKNYQKVIEALKGKTGQPVVLIHRWIEHEGCSGFGGTRTPAVKRVVTVGVISGEELIFDYNAGTCVLPTSSQASDSNRQLELPGNPDNGLIVASSSGGLSHMSDLGYDLGRKLGGDFSDPDHLFIHGMEAMTLAIGQDEIGKWLTNAEGAFRAINEFTEVVKLCKKLGVDPIDPSDERLKALLGIT